MHCSFITVISYLTLSVLSSDNDTCVAWTASLGLFWPWFVQPELNYKSLFSFMYNIISKMLVNGLQSTVCPFTFAWRLKGRLLERLRLNNFFLAQTLFRVSVGFSPGAFSSHETLSSRRTALSASGENKRTRCMYNCHESIVYYTRRME